jgi:hypothetical protein
MVNLHVENFCASIPIEESQQTRSYHLYIVLFREASDSETYKLHHTIGFFVIARPLDF